MELWNIFIERRYEVIEQEDKFKAYVLEQMSAPLFEENMATLATLFNKELRTKQRVTTLMGRDQNDLKRLKKESIEKVAKLAEKLGMNLENKKEMPTEENVEDDIQMDDAQHEHEANGEDAQDNTSPEVEDIEEENIVEKNVVAIEKDVAKEDTSKDHQTPPPIIEIPIENIQVQPSTFFPQDNTEHDADGEDIRKEDDQEGKDASRNEEREEETPFNTSVIRRRRCWKRRL